MGGGDDGGSVNTGSSSDSDDAGADYPRYGGDGDASYTGSSSVRRATLRLDDWLAFHVDAEAAALLMQLRQKWHSLFLRRMRAPTKPWSQFDESTVRSIVSTDHYRTLIGIHTWHEGTHQAMVAVR